MIHESNVNNVGWLDIVFSNRNKSYGAYALRSQSGAIQARALLIGVAGFLLAFIGPFVYKKIFPDVYATPVEFTPLKEVTYTMPKQPEKPEPLKAAALPVNKVKTVKFSAQMQVVPDEQAVEIPKMAEMQDAVVGSVTQDGPAATGNAIEKPAHGTGADLAVETNEIFNTAAVEVFPEFEGGMKAWAKYIQKNLRYPYKAQEENIQGKVFVTFVVEKDGSITDVTIIKGIGGGCDEEAARVIKKSPLWKAGMQNNKKVRVRYNMPIFFSLMP